MFSPTMCLLCHLSLLRSLCFLHLLMCLLSQHLIVHFLLMQRRSGPQKELHVDSSVSRTAPPLPSTFSKKSKKQ